MNVGILGAGFIVPYFIENIKTIEGYHLRALWARDESKAEKFKEDVDYISTNLEEILTDEKIDTIYVALPNSLHYEYAKKVVEHGKHVIVEKPFCVSEQQAQQLFELGKKNNVLVFEAIMTKYNPCYIEAKKHLHELGNIRIVNVNFSQYSRKYEKFKNGIIAPSFSSELAGGSLMDLGVYNIHFVVGMFGRPTHVQYYPNKVNGIDTSGILVLEYPDFKACLINAKDCSSQCHGTIEGDNGTMICTSTTSRVSNFIINKNDGSTQTINFEKDGEFIGMKYEFKEFLRMFTSKDMKACAEHAKETLDVQYVLSQAIETGQLYK